MYACMYVCMLYIFVEADFETRKGLKSWRIHDMQTNDTTTALTSPGAASAAQDAGLRRQLSSPPRPEGAEPGSSSSTGPRRRHDLPVPEAEEAAVAVQEAEEAAALELGLP